jgi:uncharacterized coiled-coil protein SlyX
VSYDRAVAAATHSEKAVDGLRAYGFRSDGAIDEAEATVVQAVATQLLDSATVRGVTTWLNESGYKTVSGRRWEPITVRRMMLNPRIAPVVGDEIHTQVVELLSDPARRSPTVSRSYLLTVGLAVCGRCGKPLVSRPSNGGRRGYVCRSGPPTEGCGRIRIAADPFEDEVVARALARLSSPRTRAKLADAVARRHVQLERDDADLAASRQRLAEVGQDYGDGRIGRVEFHAARDRVTERIAKLERSMADSRRLAAIESAVAFPSAQIEDLLLWWSEADVQQRRALLALLIERVEVMPVEKRGSRTFDPDRLKMVWR